MERLTYLSLEDFSSYRLISSGSNYHIRGFKSNLYLNNMISNLVSYLNELSFYCAAIFKSFTSSFLSTFVLDDFVRFAVFTRSLFRFAKLFSKDIVN